MGTVELSTDGQPYQPCIATQSGGTVCTYPLAAYTWLTMREKGKGRWKFAGWEAFGCTPGLPESCIVLVGPTVTAVGARFDDKDDD